MELGDIKSQRDIMLFIEERCWAPIVFTEFFLMFTKMVPDFQGKATNTILRYRSKSLGDGVMTHYFEFIIGIEEGFNPGFVFTLDHATKKFWKVDQRDPTEAIEPVSAPVKEQDDEHGLHPTNDH